MNIRLHSFRRRSVLLALVSLPTAALALDTASIAGSTASPNCLDYRVVGICYWLLCTPAGCRVRKSTKVRHYIPDAVVSSYANPGDNPWSEIRALSLPNVTAKSGGSRTAGSSFEDPLLRFKNVDVIGHPGSLLFNRFAAQNGYTCKGASTALMPYLLSTLDTLAWRYGIPESAFPEALIPGRREVGSRTSGNLWGAIYPRSGFIQQADDFKAGAVIAQRAGDIVTRRGQAHVYVPLLAQRKDGYWPAGPLLESDSSTGKWQQLSPRITSQCAVFPTHTSQQQSKRGDYAWALWRPYSCCKRRGQTFMGSVDFAGSQQ